MRGDNLGIIGILFILLILGIPFFNVKQQEIVGKRQNQYNETEKSDYNW